MSVKVFGPQAVVTALNRALFNTSPSNEIFSNQVAQAGTSAAAQDAFANSFVSANGPKGTDGKIDPVALMKLALANVGFVDAAGDPTAKDLAAGFFGADVPQSQYGTQLLFLLNALSGAESNGVLGPFALAWNDEVTSSFKYSEDVTHTTPFVGDFNLDTTAPVVTAPAAPFSYAENQASGFTVGTVAATDNIKVTDFKIVSGDTGGLFAIDATGKITLTAASVGATVADNPASNNFEVTPNTFTLGVQALDAAGNKSATTNVVVNVTDVDDIPPVITGSVVSGTRAVLTYSEALLSTGASPSVTDFSVNLKNGAGNIAITSVQVTGNTVVLNLGRAPLPSEFFTVAYTPGTNPVKDAATNAAAAFTARDLVADTTAPVVTAGQTFSYVELVAGVGPIKASTDVVGTVATTDANGVSAFAITAGNESGFFAINSQGQITLTAAGLAGAADNFEVLPNNFPLTITATDGAGNVSTPTVVNVNVTNNTSDDVTVPSGTPIQLTASADNVSPSSPVSATLTTANADVIAGFFDALLATGNTVGLSTLTLADGINGGDGRDTFQLTVSTGAGAINPFNSTAVPVFSNIEILQVRSVGAAASALALNNITPSLDTLNFDNSTKASVVTGASKTVATIGLSNVSADDADVSVTSLAGLTAATDALTVNVSNNSSATTGTANTYAVIAVAGAAASDGFDLVTVNSNGGNTRLDNFTVADNAASTMRTLTVNGASAFRVNTSLDFFGTTGTFDASNATGAMNVLFGTENINAKGGSGADRFAYWAAADFNGSDVLNGGDGRDTLAITEATNVAATALNTAINATTSIEVLDMASAGAALDASLLTTIKDFAFSGGGANVITNTVNTNNFALSVAASSPTFTPLIDSLTDVLNLSVTSTAGVIIASAGGATYETVNIVSTTASGANEITALTLNANGTAVVTGAAFTTTLATASNINASGATGVQTLTGQGGSNTISGGPANDILNGAAGDDVISGNGGVDIFGATAALASVANVGSDDLTGGAGNDLFYYTKADAPIGAATFVDVGVATVVTAPGVGDTFTGLEVIRDLTGADVIDLDAIAAVAFAQNAAYTAVAANQFALVPGQFVANANRAAAVFTVGDGVITNGGDTDTLLMFNNGGATEYVVLVGVNVTEAGLITQTTLGQLSNFGS